MAESSEHKVLPNPMVGRAGGRQKQLECKCTGFSAAGLSAVVCSRATVQEDALKSTETTPHVGLLGSWQLQCRLTWG